MVKIIFHIIEINIFKFLFDKSLNFNNTLVEIILPMPNLIIEQTGCSFIKGTIYNFLYTLNFSKSIRLAGQSAHLTLITSLTYQILKFFGNSRLNVLLSYVIGNLYNSIIFHRNLKGPFYSVIFSLIFY